MCADCSGGGRRVYCYLRGDVTMVYDGESSSRVADSADLPTRRRYIVSDERLAARHQADARFTNATPAIELLYCVYTVDTLNPFFN